MTLGKRRTVIDCSQFCGIHISRVGKFSDIRIYDIVLSISSTKKTCAYSSQHSLPTFSRFDSRTSVKTATIRESSMTLSCTLQFDIACSRYTRLLLFVFVRLHLFAAVYSFFSLLLSWRSCHIVFAVSTLSLFLFTPRELLRIFELFHATHIFFLFLSRILDSFVL